MMFIFPLTDENKREKMAFIEIDNGQRRVKRSAGSAVILQGPVL